MTESAVINFNDSNKTLKCKIVAYNFSPKGGVEGLLVEAEGKQAQVVCPTDKGAEVARTNPIGQTVELHVEAEPASHKGEAVHPVYQLVIGEPSERRRGATAHSAQSFEGVVARLNFARHGEANGVVLDTGDFIHLKPHGMKQAGLNVGDTVKAEGESRPMELGGRVLEATTVNGIRLKGKH